MTAYQSCSVLTAVLRCVKLNIYGDCDIHSQKEAVGICGSQAMYGHLQVFDRRWFHNKRCLDIGCNEGVVTLAVVQRFAPLSMLGVDIDEGLVKAACRCLNMQCCNQRSSTPILPYVYVHVYVHGYGYVY